MATRSSGSQLRPHGKVQPKWHVALAHAPGQIQPDWSHRRDPVQAEAGANFRVDVQGIDGITAVGKQCQAPARMELVSIFGAARKQKATTDNIAGSIAWANAVIGKTAHTLVAT